MTLQDQQPGCGRAGHDRACHMSKSHSWLAQLTFLWGLVYLRRGMQNPGWRGGGSETAGGRRREFSVKGMLEARNVK